MEKPRLIPGDSVLIENIVNYLKAKGIFDEFRHECLADVDTKSSCQNLSQRVDGYTTKFLANETWHPDLNKNELRNKLRRHIDESGMLAVGADHVVEQVINPKIAQLFLPRIKEVVHQYLNEENAKLNKKDNSNEEATTSEKPSSESIEGTSSKTKSTVSDPIADILAFSYSKPKPANTNPAHSKTETVQAKNPDLPIKCEKRKEDKYVVQSIKSEPAEPSADKPSTDKPSTDKPGTDKPSTDNPASATSELKIQVDSKELVKVKKEFKSDESELPTEIQKQNLSEDLKTEKKKIDDVKTQANDSGLSREDSVGSKSVTSLSSSFKSSSSSKNKDSDKNKTKLKPLVSQKASSTSEPRKVKPKESPDCTSKSYTDKHVKISSKLPKTPSKEPTSPFKSGSSSKSSREEKSGDSLRSKGSDSGSHKALDPAKKTYSKPSSYKKDTSAVKSKGHVDKEKMKIIKLSKTKGESSTRIDSSGIEKGNKSSVYYSSSHESSQGSDQERSSLNISSKERQKFFSKHSKKDSHSRKDGDLKSMKKHIEKKRSESDLSEGNSKKHKSEKSSKTQVQTEKQKESSMIHDSSKISSRSNSFGSASSMSSPSTASKDNSILNSDDTGDNAIRSAKKKKQLMKIKDQCRSPQNFPPPPPPPPPSSSLTAETPSSAEMSSFDDTQSSQDSDSGSEQSGEKSSSDSETDAVTSNEIKFIDALKEETMSLEMSTDNLNDFYDMFLYSSSSSEFEGYITSSPEKASKRSVQESDVIVSSVHTSDLSSFDDEVSNDCSCEEDTESENKTIKKRLTLKEAEEILRKRAALQHSRTSKEILPAGKFSEMELNDRHRKSSSNLSSEEEAYSKSEPKRELRRERKLNPKYASSEYTSIFNSKKESFITKQPDSKVADQVYNSVSNLDSNGKRKEFLIHPIKEKSPIKRRLSVETNESPSTTLQPCETEGNFKITNVAVPEFESQNYLSKQFSHSVEMSSEESTVSSEDEMQLPENDNSSFLTNDHYRITLKISKTPPKCNTSKSLTLHTKSVKRKLDTSSETCSPTKRPCSRSSIDSCSSESVVNENKPFNNEAKSSSVSQNLDLKTHTKLKEPLDVADNLKKDILCKQRTNNNGDILGKIEHMKKKCTD